MRLKNLPCQTLKDTSKTRFDRIRRSTNIGSFLNQKENPKFAEKEKNQ